MWKHGMQELDTGRFKPALAEVLDYTLVEQPRLRVLSASELSGRIREAMKEAD